MIKYLIIGLLFIQTTFGQSKLEFITQFSEGILGSNTIDSYSPFNIETLAANAGIRSGLRLNFSNFFSANAKLGVQQYSFPTGNGHFIPLDFSINSKLGGVIGLRSKKTLELEIGFSSVLYNRNNASQPVHNKFGLSSALCLGTSYLIPIADNYSLSFGVSYRRFTDNLAISPNQNDMLDYHTSVIVSLGGNKNSTEKLSSDLLELSKELVLTSLEHESLLKARDREIAILTDVLKDFDDYKKTSTDSTPEIPEKSEPINNESYAIIIASLKSYDSASKLSLSTGPNSIVLLDEPSNNYRVAFEVVQTLEEAEKLSSRLKRDGVDNWILTL